MIALIYLLIVTVIGFSLLVSGWKENNEFMKPFLPSKEDKARWRKEAEKRNLKLPK